MMRKGDVPSSSGARSLSASLHHCEDREGGVQVFPCPVPSPRWGVGGLVSLPAHGAGPPSGLPIPEASPDVPRGQTRVSFAHPEAIGPEGQNPQHVKLRECGRNPRRARGSSVPSRS